jgi:hypothetical protein
MGDVQGKGGRQEGWAMMAARISFRIGEGRVAVRRSVQLEDGEQ